jgi:hypothetical protein
MPGFLAALDWRFETAFILIRAVAITAASLWCLHRDRGKSDGDYAAFLEGDFDPAWFDTVIENIENYPVLIFFGHGEPRGGAACRGR